MLRHSWLFSKISIIFASLFLFVGMMLANSVSAETEVKDSCLANSEWFPHANTKEPNNNMDFESNCAFHQWSWQMFLWLTQDVSGKPRFLSFKDPNSLLDKKPSAEQIDGLMPRLMKHADATTADTLDEFVQAGSDAILVDKNGRAIYYSQHINDTYSKFITDNELTNPLKVRQFPPETSFDIGTLELKASWKIVTEADKNVDKFFTTKDHVYKLVNKDGKIWIDRTQTEEVTLALVGLHIAGVVKGHPEMIWATFEHKLNAPNVPASFTPNTKISDKDFTFYKANTPFKECNVNTVGRQILDEKTQKLSPVTQVCRQYQYGNKADKTDKTDKTDSFTKKNDRNIANINHSADQQLNKQNLWANYYEVGAIWFPPKKELKPDMKFSQADDKELLTGSLKLSNAVIETFTQIQTTKDNCFRCHDTQQRFGPAEGLDPLPGMNLNISHAFVNLYFRSQALQQKVNVPKSATNQ